MNYTNTDHIKCVAETDDLACPADRTATKANQTKRSLLEKIALLMALKKPTNEHIKLYVLDFYFDSEPITA